jgi:hypothetical protein
MGMISSALAHGAGLGAFDELILFGMFAVLAVGMALILRAAGDTSKDAPADEDTEKIERPR